MEVPQNKISKFNLSTVIFLALSMVPVFVFAQEKKERRAAQNYLSEAQQSLQKEKFADAEADFRQAISLDPTNETAKYNLGAMYYEKEKNEEAMLRFKQAATTANSKAEKHRAFHNLGNTFMNAKRYQEAVAAYKDALRNNPKDDETRYNLALAKDLLDKNPPPPEENNEDNKDQEKEQNEKEQEEKEKQNQDKEETDQGEGQQDEDKQEDGENKAEPNEPKEEDGDKPQQQQQVPGQLSPQQVKSLLEAMNNEEKKVQDKINAEKQKGVKVKSDKDW